MKSKNKSRIVFFVDQDLFLEGQSQYIEEVLKSEKIKIEVSEKDLSEKNLNIIFTTSKKLKKNYWPKNKLFICSSRENIDGPQILKCDFMSFPDIEKTINEIFEAERKMVLNNKIKESEILLEKIKLKNEIATEDLLISKKSEYELILDLEIELLKFDKISDWNQSFKAFIKKVNWLSFLSLVRLNEDLDEDILRDENTLMLKLPFEDYFVLLKVKGQSIIELSIVVELLINVILKNLQLIDHNLIRNDDEIDFWKRIFAKIPYPMAVITTLGDLLIYNELFAKIGILPKECLTYKDQDSIEIHQQYYVVKKIEFEIFEQKVCYFVFYTAEKMNLNNSDKKKGIDELGIVSSSIAHELNNPLAGILAALSLISLEDTWSDESLMEIEDMRNGAKRCKELVEIFLGFSRFSPNQKYQASIKGALDQAINLLRFRMVESNLRIDMRYSPTLETFQGNLNASIISMIFYLIVSELLTAFAHHRLLTQNSLNQLCGEVVEFSNQIFIKLDDDFEYENNLAQSKLIQHLLLFEKMEINFLKREIRLIYKNF